MKKNKTLLAGLAGILIGLACFVTARYMLTNFTYTQAQSDRSDAVKYAGITVFIFGLGFVLFYIYKLIASHSHTNS